MPTPDPKKVYNYIDGGTYRPLTPRLLSIPSNVQAFIDQMFSVSNTHQELLDSTDRDTLNSYIPDAKELPKALGLSTYEYEQLYAWLTSNGRLSDLWSTYKPRLSSGQINTLYSKIFGAKSRPNTVVQNLITAHMVYMVGVMVETEEIYGAILPSKEAPLATVVPDSIPEGAVLTLVTALGGAGNPTEYEERAFSVTVKVDGGASTYAGPLSITATTKPTGAVWFVDETVVSEFHATATVSGTKSTNIRLSKSGSWVLTVVAPGLGINTTHSITVVDKEDSEIAADNLDIETNNPEPSEGANCDVDIVAGAIDLGSCGTGTIDPV